MSYEQTKHKINKLWNDQIENDNNEIIDCNENSINISAIKSNKLIQLSNALRITFYNCTLNDLQNITIIPIFSGETGGPSYDSDYFFEYKDSDTIIFHRRRLGSTLYISYNTKDYYVIRTNKT